MIYNKNIAPFIKSSLYQPSSIRRIYIMNIQEAKTIRLADYLQSLGYSPVKQQGNNLWYKSPFRQETEASFKVSVEHNLWFDYGLGRGGNIIALAQELYCSDYVLPAW